MYWINDPVVINGEEGKVLSIDLKGRYTVLLNSGSVVQNVKYKDLRKESKNG